MKHHERRLDGRGNNEPSLLGQAMQGAALLAMALVMSACGKEPSAPPAPMTSAAQPGTATTRDGASGTSVPDAASVLPPSAEPKGNPPVGRTNDAMTRDQESSAMPMPGQNNDHSAPVVPAKRASSP